MGFFSWITQDTGRSICNTYSGKKPFRVILIDNKGNKYVEEDYEGYGEFGGVDFYELLAVMNGLETREEGIDLAYADNQDDVLYPNLVESDDWEWVNENPETCEFQGYFYGDGEENFDD